MTISSSDRRGMERLAYWLRYCGDCDEWRERDGRIVYAVLTDPASADDKANLIDNTACAVTLTIEPDGRISIREFNAAPWDAEEDRLCMIGVEIEDAEWAEIEAEDAAIQQGE